MSISVLAEMLRISVGLLLITLVAGTENCINGTIFPAGDGCNSCVCLKNRTVLCTQRDCVTVLHRIKKRQMPDEKKRVCSRGKPYIPDGDCNYCLCTKDGQNSHACTRKVCVEFRSVKDEPCPHGRGKFMSKDGCNKCRCDRHNFARCSKKKCVN